MLFFKNFKKFISLIFISIILFLPVLCLAGDGNTPPATQKEITDNLGKFSGTTGPYQAATKTTMSEIIGSAINVFLSLLGVIFIVLIIYAGYNWMTAGGDEEKVKKAQDTIKKAVIGLIIIVSSYAIWNFILYKVLYVI